MESGARRLDKIYSFFKANNFSSINCFLLYLKFIWKELPSWTMIGRWLELRVVRVRHSEFKAMCEVAIVMSGEVGSPREGTRVGNSMLRRMRSVFVRNSVIRVPLASASVLIVLEY